MPTHTDIAMREGPSPWAAYDPLSDTSRLLSAIAFGPNISRRLGLVLGLNIMPPGRAFCTYRCAYCPLAPVLELVPPLGHGGSWPSAEEIKGALIEALEKVRPYFKLDAVALIGNGEPTLHPELNSIMKAAREAIGSCSQGLKLAVFTNSSTLGREAVVDALSIADYVVAKLDSAWEGLWMAINRPHKALGGLAKVLNGLSRLREALSSSRAKLVISITLVRLLDGTTNASGEHLRALAKLLMEIGPDQVHVEAPLPQAGPQFEPLPRQELVEAALTVADAVGRDSVFLLMGTTAPIPASLIEQLPAGGGPTAMLSEKAELLLLEGPGARTRLRILVALSRRKMNCNQVAKAVGVSWWSAQRHLKLLLEAGLIRAVGFGRRIYYAITTSGLRALANVRARAGELEAPRLI